MTDIKVPKPNIQRIDGRLHLIRGVKDDSGNIEHRVVMPLGVEFGLRDLAEIVVGATVLAIPVGYTEEVWVLGERLSNFHATLIVLVSLLFTAASPPLACGWRLPDLASRLAQATVWRVDALDDAEAGS